MAKKQAVVVNQIRPITDIIRDLDSFSSVGAGQTANVQIAVGPTYDEIHLEFSGMTVDQITAVRLSLNADDIIDVSGRDLFMMEAYKGNAYVPGNLTIPLREMLANTADGQNLTGLVTLPGDTITLEVEIAAEVAAPVLKGWYVASASRPVRLVYPRLKKYSYTATALGVAEWNNLPRGNRIKRIFIGGADGGIESLELERDQLKIWKQSAARNNYQQSRYRLVPQFGYFIFDAVYDGWVIAKSLVTVSQSFIIRFVVAEPGALPILVESIEAQR